MVQKTKVKVVRQPGDGSCLYHSLCEGWNSLPSRERDGGVTLTAPYLRHFLSTLVLERSDREIAGTPLSDWIRMETGESPEEYARRMRKGGGWGGSVECMLFADTFGVCVSVYRERRKGSSMWIGEKEDGNAVMSLEKVVRWGGDEARCKKERGHEGGGAKQVVRLLYTPYLHYDALVEDS